MSPTRPAGHPRALAAVLAVALAAASSIWLTGGSAAAAGGTAPYAPVVDAATGRPVCDALDEEPDYADIACNADGASAYFGVDAATMTAGIVTEDTPRTTTGSQPPVESTTYVVQLGVDGRHRASIGVDGKGTNDSDYVYAGCAGAQQPSYRTSATLALAAGTLRVDPDSGGTTRMTFSVPRAAIAGCAGVTPDSALTPFVGTSQAGPLENINKDFFLGGAVSFEAVNQAPTATDDEVPGVVAGTAARTVDVLANDTDPNRGQVLTVASVGTSSTAGTVSLDGGVVRYAPPATRPLTGTDTFTYVVSDGKGGTDDAAVTVRFPAPVVVNVPPSADDEDVTVPEDAEPTVVDVLTGDSDADGGTLSVTAVSDPARGTATLTGGVVRYAPDADVSGADSFTYTISDGQGGTASATVRVTVTPVDDPPVAVDDVLALDEDAPATVVAVLGNDTDRERDALSVTSVTQPAHGTVTLVDGTVRYAPAKDFAGADAFTYVVSDGTAEDTGLVQVTVRPVNDAPDARDDAATVAEDAEATEVPVRVNDVDVDGGPLVVTAVTQPASGGSVALVDGRVSFTPSKDFAGRTTFGYTVSDGAATGSAVVTVTVSPTDDGPVAVDDERTVGEDAVATVVDVLTNDLDADGPLLRVTATTAAANGVVTLVDGVVRYAPKADYSGPDAFTYTVSDGTSSDTGEVRVTVTPVDDAPVADDDAHVVAEDSAASPVDVLTGDTDVDSSPLRVLRVHAAEHGTVALEGGVVRYTPAPGFVGRDHFTYVVTDGTSTDVGAVAVDVTPVDDPPLAVDDLLGIDEDSPAVPVDVLANDTDVDSAPLVVTGVTQPAGGTVTFTATGVSYRPAEDASGTDTFTYTVSDGTASDTGLVTVTVRPVDDAPVADDDQHVVDEDSAATVVDVLTGDADVDGGALEVVSASRPAHGTTTVVEGVVRYVPTAGYTGPDAFTYVVRDGRGGEDTGAVAVTVRPVDDPPVAGDDALELLEDAPATAVPVLDGDTDVDSSPLAVASVTQPEHGTVLLVRGLVTYRPDDGWSGRDTFTYVVTDGTSSDTGTVRVTVLPVNDAPVAGADALTVDEDAAATVVPVLGNDTDADGDRLSVTSVSQPAAGSAVLVDGVVRFTPAPGRSGTETFTYAVSDGQGGTGTGTVTVVVSPVNDAPVAADDTLRLVEGAAATPVAVLPNDRDDDGDPLAVTAVTQPQHGTVALVDGQVTYRPAPGRTGTDTFTYTVGDGQGGTSTATVTVTVDPRPAPAPVPPPPAPADLSLDKSGPASARPGDVLSWRLAVLNKGPGTASGFTVRDSLPVEVVLTALSGTDFACDGATVSCRYLGALPAGQTAVVTVTGRLADGLPAGSVANRAEVGPADATPGDNSDALVTSVVPLPVEAPVEPGVADLVLDLAGPPGAVQPGEALAYGMTVRNVGTGPATGFVLTDVLPTGLDLVRVGGTLTGLRTADGLTCAPGTVRCTYAGSLAPGEELRVAVDVELAVAYDRSSVANTADVALLGDPTPENNTDTATTPVLLPIAGTPDPEPATDPTPLPGPTAAPSPAPVRDEVSQPATLPFSGSRADQQLALGGGLGLVGLLLALAGRRRRSLG